MSTKPRLLCMMDLALVPESLGRLGKRDKPYRQDRGVTIK
jgi:hypothetical protein